MLISIRTLQGKVITLEVQSSNTIKHVKTEIQRKEGIRLDLQRLTLDNNKPLENRRTLSYYRVGEETILYLILRAPENSKTVAAGYGQGSETNQFCFPYGLALDDDKTMVIVDRGNHRIVEWKMGDTKGKVIAGGNGPGKQLNQLCCPTDVLIDKEAKCLIICDRGNRRIMRWSRLDGTTEGEILLDNIACWGLAMDDQKYLYISDTENNEVRRYRIGEKNGTVVAGGHRRGVGLKQLNEPNYIFVDQQQTVYVSDTWNHRVMKWKKDAEVGIVAVQGSPRGLFVDASENIYVADYGNHRLICWPNGATKGTIIAGGNGEGEEASQLYYPWGLSSDQHGHLLVADHSNHRVQRFPLQPTA